MRRGKGASRVIRENLPIFYLALKIQLILFNNRKELELTMCLVDNLNPNQGKNFDCLSNLTTYFWMEWTVMETQLPGSDSACIN